MQIIKFFKSVSLEVTLFAITSLLALLVKILVLNKYPATYKNIFELGLLTESILSSIVSGYIFFIFVNHLQEFRKNTIVAPFILKHSQRIVGECKAQLNELSKFSGTTLDLSTLIENDIKDIFSKMSPKDDAPLLMPNLIRNANWLEFFGHHVFRSSNSIQKLLVQLPYLPPKILALITEIEDSPHFSTIRYFQNKTCANENLSSFADSFFKYSKLCKELESLNKIRF